MSRDIARSPLAWGLVAGLLGIIAAAWFPSTPAHAVATDHIDNFAIATGPVSDELEAIFFLDFLTGSLKCGVLSRSTGKFMSAFEASVLEDLGVRPNSNPKFLLVTGIADLRATGGQMQPGNSVVYVAETTTGRVAAYAVPWTNGLATTVIPFKGRLLLLDVLQFRTAAVRGQ